MLWSCVLLAAAKIRVSASWMKDSVGALHYMRYNGVQGEY